MKVAVTGAGGFIGRNLELALRRTGAHDVIGLGRHSSPDEWDRALAEADAIFHLAGINRPQWPGELEKGNAGLTQWICERLSALNRAPVLVLASSTQAGLDNDYGRSKRAAEEACGAFAEGSGSPLFVFRLPGVFGKWCRPNYNSVVATFCHNISRGLPISVSNPSRVLDLVYVDDVVATFAGLLVGEAPARAGDFYRVGPVHRIGLGELADTIRGFAQSRLDLRLPDLAEPLVRALYATYVAALPVDGFAYSLTQRVDPRGELAELIKSPHIGQLFLSRTRPGIARGNHYHDSKVEKFVVVEGDAVVQFRHTLGGELLEYRVSGIDFRVIDIPPGYTHRIVNVGQGDLIVLFWADEIFDPARADTHALPVLAEREGTR